MLELNRTIHYISFGIKSNLELSKAIKSIAINNYIGKVNILTDIKHNEFGKYSYLVDKISANNIINSRYYKTRLNYYQTEYNLYLDSDTVINNSSFLNIFTLLQESSFDLIITPSKNQNRDAFWHINDLEKTETINQLGYIPLQLQGGVFAWKRSEVMNNFFAEWHKEYNYYQDQDQAALVRALNNCCQQDKPVRVYLLSSVFNGGSVITHNFGAIRNG